LGLPIASATGQASHWQHYRTSLTQRSRCLQECVPGPKSPKAHGIRADYEEFEYPSSSKCISQGDAAMKVVEGSGSQGAFVGTPV
jgi:hypothetical protein